MDSEVSIPLIITGLKNYIHPGCGNTSSYLEQLAHKLQSTSAHQVQSMDLFKLLDKAIQFLEIACVLHIATE